MKLDAQDIRFIEYHVKQYGGIINAIEVCLKELDATYTLPDGYRPRQTNSYVWKKVDAEFQYLLNNALDHNIIDNNQHDTIIKRYFDICNNNKEYEKENPPVIFDKKVSKGTKKVRIDKVKSMFDSKETLNVGETAKVSKPKKETIADRKAKLVSSKSVSFAFNGTNFKKK